MNTATDSEIIVVSTRAPTFPFSGGMAPQVARACREFSKATWYGVENIDSIERELAFALAAEGLDSSKVKDLQIALQNNLQKLDVDDIDVQKLIFDRDTYKGHYNSFSNEFLWPICHDRPDLVVEITDEAIAHNEAVNRRLAKKIAADLRAKNDTTTPIWVQDYHHKNLARFLREEGVINPITFFNHIPDPTPETLSLLSERSREVFLRNHNDLAYYDVINYQTCKNARRGMQYSGIENPPKLKAYESTSVRLACDDGYRNVKIGHFPISIDTAKVAQNAKGSLQSTTAKELHAQCSAPFLLVNFERNDYSKGIEVRLMAYINLMREHPELAGKVQIVIGAEPTRADLPAYVECSERVKELANWINEQTHWHHNGNPPVILVNKQIPNPDVCVLLRQEPGQTKICPVTSPTDGMNLVCKEFVAAQDPNNAGRLIISADIGAAPELDQNGKGAITYRHYDPATEKRLGQDIAVANLKNALLQAIIMPQEEANERCANMRAHLNEYDLLKWAKENAHSMQLNIKHSPNKPEHRLPAHAGYTLGLV